ncbi:MAG: hypothetical protein HY276_03350 [Ignavibacteriales bacterium]|nr:hypothetical protein [Ignavibacteriales bacterium]MBI3787271.1 hypothetical protein [Ignavibacteriales bacterium]
MNNRITFYTIAVIVFVTMVTMIGCKGAEGPQGPPGETTLVNLEGFAPGIKCGTCHIPDADTTYYLLARSYQWSQSKHANGGDLERNSSGCAGCHTSEGFVQRMRNLAGGSISQIVSDQAQPSPPGCFACHSPHLRANFSLRDTTPVTIKSYVAGVPDAVFDYGRGNLCVKCHQTRTTSALTPIPDPTKTAATDTISITSSRWYPHYGVNGQMLMGTGGFQFTGYTYTGNSYHTTATAIKQKGCPICHMAQGVYPPNLGTGKGGGHTMNIRYEWEGTTGSVVAGCKTAGCHPSTMTSPDIVGASTGGVPVQTLVTAYVDTLEQLMTDKNGVLTGGRYKREWLVLGAEGLGINASTSKPLKIAPASRAGALWNYMFIKHEGSKGVHNTKYAVELLKSSVLELRK